MKTEWIKSFSPKLQFSSQASFPAARTSPGWLCATPTRRRSPSTRPTAGRSTTWAGPSTSTPTLTTGCRYKRRGGPGGEWLFKLMQHAEKEFYKHFYYVWVNFMQLIKRKLSTVLSNKQNFLLHSVGQFINDVIVSYQREISTFLYNVGIEMN